MRLLHLALLIAVCSGAKAHQLGDASIEISRIWQGSSLFMHAIIDNTHSGYRVRCAFYDQDGQILNVKQTDTKEIATKMMIATDGFQAKDVKSYLCVYDN